MNKLFLLLLLLCAFKSFGQYAETIRSGRPGQAIGARTLGANVFQLQTGLSFTDIDFEDSSQNTFAQSNVFRLGILERLEVSAVLVWQNDKFEETTINGISNTQIGARYSLFTNKGWRPSVAVQGRLLLKLQDKDYRRQETGTRFIVATGNKLSDTLFLVTNWGITHIGNNSGPNYSYVINLSYSLTEKIGVFVETYGSLNTFNIDFDAGFSYLLNNDLQLDFSFGIQDEADTSNWFIDAGISWRFDWRKS